jgi:hypothetical protein
MLSTDYLTPRREDAKMLRQSSGFFEAIGDPLDPIFEGCQAEVHEEPERQVHQPQVGEHLLGMDRGVAFH